MSVRSWLGPGASAVAVLSAVGVIAFRGEELVEAMNLQRFSSNLPELPQTSLSDAMALVAQPWIALAVLALAIFIAGMWIGRVFERMRSARPRDLEILARQLFNVSNRVKDALFKHEDSLDPKVEADVRSLFSRCGQIGVIVPEIDFDDMDLKTIEALWIYLESVYPIIIEGNVAQAKTRSQNLTDDFHDKLGTPR